MSWRNRALVAGVLAIWLLTSLRPLSHASTPQVVVDIEGVTLVYNNKSYASHDAVFAIMLAGRGHQGPADTHVAHIAEHLVFRQPLANGDSLAQHVDGWGGSYNGWTGYEHTQFEVVVPTQHIPQAVELLTRSLLTDTATSESYYKEMISLVRELNYMTTTYPAAALHAATEAIFAGTQYAETLFDVPINSVLLPAVQLWKNREYTPDRLVIVVNTSAPLSSVTEALKKSVPSSFENTWSAPSVVPLNPLPHKTLDLPTVKGDHVFLGFSVDSTSARDRAYLDIFFTLFLQTLSERPPTGVGKPSLASGLHTSNHFAYLIAYELRNRRMDFGDLSEAFASALDDFLTREMRGEEISELLVEATTQAYSPQAAVSLQDAFLAGLSYIPNISYSQFSELSRVEASQLAKETTQTILKYRPDIRITTVHVVGKGSSINPAATVLTAGTLLSLAYIRWRRLKAATGNKDKDKDRL